MPQALIILGAILALAGIGSIAAGAPSWVLGLGLGTALIQSGAVGLVGGFLLIGIGFVLRALRDLTRRLDALAPGAPIPARAPAAAPRPPAKRESVPAPSARREPPSFGGREEPREPMLERENPADFGNGEDRPRPRSRFGNEPEPREGRETREPREPREPRVAPRLPSAQERNRPRPPVPERATSASRGPSFDEYEDDLPPPPARNAGGNSAPAPSTTVVRSGIIGGMAYTLYTDGSIEAELPIGTVRFASIEELQDHVSQTGEDADVDFGGPQPPRNEPLR
jgi:hypothetical protein